MPHNPCKKGALLGFPCMDGNLMMSPNASSGNSNLQLHLLL